jgi:hypothetical protein
MNAILSTKPRAMIGKRMHNIMQHRRNSHKIV